MRPLHLLLLLAALAGLLVGAFLLVGRGDPKPETAGGETPAAPADAAEDRGPAIEIAALDGTGIDAESTRAATPAAAAPGPAAAPARKAKPTVALAGRVVGNLGKPIEGATVYAAERNEITELPLDEVDPVRDAWVRRVETVTDAEGRFRLEPEAGAKVALAVRAPGFAPLDRDFSISTRERDLGDLAMDASVILSGRVLTAAGRPIEGARIARLSSRSEAFVFPGRPRGVTVAETDAQGHFRIDQLAAGPWNLLVSEEDHPDLVQSGETERPGTVESDLVFTLADGAQIRGRLVGAPEGTAGKLLVRAVPRAGEEGTAFDNPPAFATGPRLAKCADDGTFVLKGLRRDENYRLVARESNREPFGGVRSASVNARSGDLAVELVYQPDTAVVFQVVDAKTDRPIVNLDVQAGRAFLLPLLDEVGRAIRNFPEGKVRYGSLPPSTRGAGRSAAGGDAGSVKLRIEAAGYQVFERSDIAVFEGRDNDLGILRLEPAPVVAVLVLDAGSKAPVEGAQVSLLEEKPEEGVFGARIGMSIEDDSDEGEIFAVGTAQRARTGADGRAVVTSLPGKVARIRVRHPGHCESRSEPIALPEKEDLEHTVHLGVGGSVTVLVVDPRGTPVSGAGVDHEGPDRKAADMVLSNASLRTDSEGRLLFEHLAPGTHRFRIGGGSAGGVFNMEGGGHAVVRRVVRGGSSESEGWATVEVAEASEETVRLVAPEKGSLAGRITEAGKPLANATVRLAEKGSTPTPFGDDGPSARTDGTGDYEIDGVEEGEYTLSVTHASRAMGFESDARVRPGENRLDLDLPVAIVEGTVTGDDGKPAAGVRVRAERASPTGRRMTMAVMVTADGSGDPEVMVGSPGSEARATTDETGHYTLRGVLADVDLVVQADPKDAQPARSETFKVKPDETRKNIDLKLERGGTIQIAVQRGGKPAGGFIARAVLVDGDPVPKIQFVGPSGGSKFNGLKPGKWRISLDPIQGAGPDAGEAAIPDQEVEVRVGETAKASFDVP